MPYRIPNKNLCLYTIKEVTNYINRFFQVRRGNRCRVRFFGRTAPFHYVEESYPRYQLLQTIDGDNIYSELKYGLSHFLMHIFNDEIITNKYDMSKHTKSEWKTHAESNYLGMNYVVDIDAPTINDNRSTMFDHIDEFNEVTKLVANELDELFDYNCMFSGNGFYFISESLYNDEHELSIEDYKEIFVNKFDDLDTKLEALNNKIRIKAISEGWSRYYKMPFTFHNNYPRISIPLSKNHIGDIDYKWLDYVTNTSNIISQEGNTFTINSSILSEIIKDAKWSNIW